MTRGPRSAGVLRQRNSQRDLKVTQPPIYLDNQATTPLDPAVRDAMWPYLTEHFGNPHSTDHRYGWDASRAVATARAQVADFIAADDDEIIFTSGATESCNLALRGVARSEHDPRRNRIVTLATEHPAVLETVRDLADAKHEVIVVPVESNGIVDLASLEEVLDDRTLLVSVMAVNNEIGVTQPLRAIASLCRAVGALLHTDATQAAGRLPIDIDAWDVDLLSLSGHKVYGPKGVGALYVRSGVDLKPIIAGGGQERGLRGGTIPTALVAGLGMACDLAAENQDRDRCRMAALCSHLHQRLLEAQPDLFLFGHSTLRVPGNLNIGFPGVPADQLIRSTAPRLAISTGSACSSASAEPSHVLLALGLDPEVAATSVRISLGRFTTEEDIDQAIDVLTGICQPPGRD